MLLEILSTGHFVNSSGLYSKKFEAVVPLVETVPGANDASVKSIKVKTGSAIKKNGKVTYYGTMPTKCPKKYLPVKASSYIRARRRDTEHACQWPPRAVGIKRALSAAARAVQVVTPSV